MNLNNRLPSTPGEYWIAGKRGFALARVYQKDENPGGVRVSLNSSPLWDGKVEKVFQFQGAGIDPYSPPYQNHCLFRTDSPGIESRHFFFIKDFVLCFEKNIAFGKDRREQESMMNFSFWIQGRSIDIVLSKDYKTLKETLLNMYFLIVRCANILGEDYIQFKGQSLDKHNMFRLLMRKNNIPHHEIDGYFILPIKKPA